ncbi:ABC transporter substrate-binding protein [Desulfomonile tiedjei]|uniref:ABC-type sugar transport system, periplasmic component n=1 Tax=Desulfomonile tiedjei (strain ATCC 49306 / DSM 6799 / DCB-1) TaxID=706587 RepID=I4C350_DESTA|nr:ABC transporter substrate-binding protein [Desulfomonile tiedjei]AFM23991.1 ABC-type sugar transport system, periplasmic component [Desulfomonile tiedjei DSM 6799]
MAGQKNYLRSIQDTRLFCIVVCITVHLLLCLQIFAADEIHLVMQKPDNLNLWKRLIDHFEKENSVIVRVEISPNSSTAAHALITQKLKNSDPDLDIFLMDVIWPSELVSAGWVQALDDFFPPEEQADFFPAPISACTINGKIYGVPFETSGGLLYYRKDLLEKYGFPPPDTWDRLVHIAKYIVDKERTHNPALRGYCGQFKQYEGLVCDMQEFVLSNRGKLFDNITGESTINTSQNIAAVKYVRDEIIGKIASRGVLTYEEPEAMHSFIQGNAVFLRDWPYTWEIANNSENSRIAGKIDITVLPHFPGGESVSTLGGWQFALSSFSREKDIAIKFIKYMTSPTVQKIFALEASQTCARRSVYNDPEVLRKNPHFSKLRESFDKARPRPAIPVYPAYSDILQVFYHSAITYPDSKIEELAKEADSKVQQLVEMLYEAGIFKR